MNATRKHLVWPLLGAILTLSGCEFVSGVFTLDEDIDIRVSDKKTVHVSPGEYKAKATINYSDNKMSLKIENALAGGKDVSLKIKVPGQNMYGKRILGSQIKQSWDMIADFDSSTSSGGTYSGYQSCTYTESYQVCDYGGHAVTQAANLDGVMLGSPGPRPPGHGGGNGGGGGGHGDGHHGGGGGHDDGHHGGGYDGGHDYDRDHDHGPVCRTVTVTRNGERYVSYTDYTTYQRWTISFLEPDTDNELGQMNFSDIDSDRRYHEYGACR